MTLEPELQKLAARAPLSDERVLLKDLAGIYDIIGRLPDWEL